MKLLAAITGVGAETGLAIGERQLLLGRLPTVARDALSRLPRTVLIEVELDGDAVIALGDVKPHPRVVALRAVQDARPLDALEAIAQLGALREDDLELRVAEISALIRAGFRERGQAAFMALTNHRAFDRTTLEHAFLALSHDGSSVLACTDQFLACFERLTGEEHHARCHALHLVPFERWPVVTLTRAIEEAMNDAAISRADLGELEPRVQRLAVLDASAGARVADRLATLAAKLEKSEARQRAKTLASRPDLSAIGPLPVHLREAWCQAYEGEDQLGFILVKKARLGDLSKLAARLVKDLDPAMPRRANQLLPFAHDGEERFFVLDLSRPMAGDFPVLVICKGSGGDSWENSPSSAAWLADGGALHL